MLGIYGKKLGMTQVYNENGAQIPVTVLKVEPTQVLAVRTKEKNGYSAIQVGSGDAKEKHLNKAQLGQFKKAKVSPKRHVYEVDQPGEDVPQIGDELSIGMFEGVDKLKIIGTSKGRGFAGTIKRYGFQRGPMTHGSHNKRAPGSIGACSYPARVFPGQRLPGHYGDARTSVKNVKLVKLDADNNLIFVKGSVPGAKNSDVFIGKN